MRVLIACEESQRICTISTHALREEGDKAIASQWGGKNKNATEALP